MSFNYYEETSQKLKVYGLTCEYNKNPEVVDEKFPLLAWKLTSGERGVVQKKYRIVAATTPEKLNDGVFDAWDSGEVESCETTRIKYLGSREPATDYYWRVYVWDNKGNVAVSEPAMFGIGLPGEKDWEGAAWITNTDEKCLENSQNEQGERGLPYLRKDFSTQNKKIVRAKIFSSALGVYEMYINGRRVGADYLAPGWTDYDKRVSYQGYNVTDMITPGKINVFGARLAPGWYSGRLGITQGRGHYGKDVAFIARLQIDYEDGSKDVLVTDGSWKYTDDTPLISSDILDGEYYDARREIGGSPAAWATAEVSCQSWPHVYIKNTKRNLVANVDPPIQVTDQLRAREIRRLDNGNFVVDFGQNFAGVVKITVKGNPGDVVVIKHGEVLNQDGKTVHTANLRSAQATDTYIIGSTEPETFMPSFTFHGFRYIEVSGLENLGPDDVIGMAIGSNLEQTATFECSNEMVNKLFKNILWGQKGNYLSIPTDCPQRDERRGWTGDAQVFVRTGSYFMDSMSFYRKFMTDVRDAQREDGAYPSVAPSKGFEAFGAHAWGDAGVICVWTIYRQYGDIRIVEENFAAMEKFIQYYVKASNNLTFDDTTYGDWLSVNEETDKGLVATAFFAYSTRLVARMASDLARFTGNELYEKSALYHEKLFEDIKAAYVEKYVKPSGVCGNDTQCSYVLSLAFDLVPDELRQKAADRLVENIMVKHGGHLTTGFVSVGRLCPVLTRYGYADIAYKLLTNKTYPSWGYSIERGATTIWERWNSCLDDGTIDEKLAYMNSLNHYSLGSVGEWMFSGVLGIDWDPEISGFRYFILKPNPIMDENISMTYAGGTYESIHGNIKSQWSFEKDGTLIYRATVPANTRATLYLPVKEGASVKEGGMKAEESEGITLISNEGSVAVYCLESGNYEFRIK